MIGEQTCPEKVAVRPLSLTKAGLNNFCYCVRGIVEASLFESH